MSSTSLNALDSMSSKETMVPDAERRRALFGSAVGSTIEWYDYFLYGTMSSIIFAKQFFPSDNALVSQMLALATFALAFLIRPLGGVIFSHIGDRVGRKKTLAMTLSIMGLSTVLMGLLPNYAQIGLAAPILLTILRLLQGLALGGEWGGGVLLAVEYSPAEKRGFYGAVPQTGAVLGLALGNIITSMLSAGHERGGVPVLGLAHSVRGVDRAGADRHVDPQCRGRDPVVQEDPGHARQRAHSAQGDAAAPLARSADRHRREGHRDVDLLPVCDLHHLLHDGPRVRAPTILNIVLVCALIAFPFMLFFGHLSDRIGRKKVFILGSVAFLAWIFPYFWLLDQKSVPAAALAIVVGLGIIWASYGAMIGTLLAEAFPAAIRYTGMSLGYQIGAALVGGPMPLIATALIAYFSGSYVPVVFFLAACALVSIVAVSLARDRSGQPLDD